MLFEKFSLSKLKTKVDEVKTVVITTASFSALPQTITDSRINEDHVVINSVLSNPAAQTGDWDVTTSDGTLTVSGTISGSTTLTLYLAPQQAQP